MIFRLLPDVVLSWKDVAPAALMTAVLFAIGRALIGFYLSHTATASTYGAAGSLVILLMWVYYSSMILLLGAAFSRAHSEARGRIIRARSTAVGIRRWPSCRVPVDRPRPQAPHCPSWFPLPTGCTQWP